MARDKQERQVIAFSLGQRQEGQKLPETEIQMLYVADPTYYLVGRNVVLITLENGPLACKMFRTSEVDGQQASKGWMRHVAQTITNPIPPPVPATAHVFSTHLLAQAEPSCRQRL